MAFELPKLPYDYSALEPHIDAATMEIHYTKHHGSYVEKLNKALEGTDFSDKPIEEVLKNIDKIPQDKRQAVINNGGGHANHSLFWRIMSPDAAIKPEGEIAAAISEKFDDFDNFKKEFTDSALNRFGSGWAFLISKDGSLELKSYPNQDSPLMNNEIPLLGIDVWEHAYYLKYQNKRADYIEAWWNVVNWKEVSEIYSKEKVSL